MRFGRHNAPAENDPWAVSAEQVAPPAAETAGGRELFVRHARKDGKVIAMLRAVDHGTHCVVEADVLSRQTAQRTRPGPYTFPDAHQASAFVTEAVAALMYLGCDIQAQ